MIVTFIFLYSCCAFVAFIVVSLYQGYSKLHADSPNARCLINLITSALWGIIAMLSIALVISESLYKIGEFFSVKSNDLS